MKKIKGVVPDVYKLTKANNGVVELKNTFEAGDRVQLIFDEKVQVVDVLSATESKFITSLSYTGDVFVYGREVDDFRTVDYEAVSMLNVSATQELYKKIQLLEKQLAGMSDVVFSLSEQNEKLQSKTQDIEMLKNQLLEIQNMLNIQAEK